MVFTQGVWVAPRARISLRIGAIMRRRIDGNGFRDVKRTAYLGALGIISATPVFDWWVMSVVIIGVGIVCDVPECRYIASGNRL